MKTYYFCICVIVSIIISSCAKDPVSPPPPPPISDDTLGYISGIIRDQNNTPVESVVVNCHNNFLSYSTLSQASGMYFLDSIPPGRYAFDISKNGYINHSDSITIEANDSLIMNIQLQQPTWIRITPTYIPSLNGYSGYYHMHMTPQQAIFVSTGMGSSVGNQTGLMKTTNLGFNWEISVSSPSVSKIYVGPNNSLFMCTGRTQDGNGNYVGDNRIYKSMDNGASWQSILNPNLYQTNGITMAFMPNVYFINIYGADLTTGRYYFYKSDNQGASWNLYAPVHPNYKIVALNNTTSGRVFIRNSSDSLFYTTNGTTWTLKIVPDPIQKEVILRSKILPTDEMIALYQNQYYISSSDGESYMSVNSNLTSNLPKVETFVFNSNNELFAFSNNSSNIHAIYRSSDKCATMNRFDEGLPPNYILSGLCIFDDYAYTICNGSIYKTSVRTTEQSKNQTVKINNLKRINTFNK